MKSRVLKKNEKCYLQLPPEFAGIDEVEIFQLRDGYYLLSIPLEGKNDIDKVKIENGLKEEHELDEQAIEKWKREKAGNPEPQKTKNPETKENGPNEKEKTLLRKLVGVKFENRTPAYVSKYFTDSEQKMLVEMEKKGYLNLFKGKKYADGVYNIGDSMFQLLKENTDGKQPNADPQTTKQSTDKSATRDSPPSLTSEASASNPVHPPLPNNPLLADLFRVGYTVLANNNQAYEFSESLRSTGKNNDVLGIKGFDGKYYVVSKTYFTELSYLIKNSVKGDMTVASIAKLCKTDETGCRAVLMLMAERGDAIEKKKDFFALV
ncbi:MAG: hypothetical protein WCT31_01980 [Candidatus Micrarchaeia archaeon]